MVHFVFMGFRHVRSGSVRFGEILPGFNLLTLITWMTCLMAIATVIIMVSVHFKVCTIKIHATLFKKVV